MPTIVGKEAPSVTLYYYKGNAFSYDFTVSGDVPPSAAIAKIVRVSDPEEQALIQFTSGLGLALAGQQVQLDKTAQEMILPPGTYKFIMEGVVGGVHMAFVQRSLFVVSDAIGQQLDTPQYITATAISDSEITVGWDTVPYATQYTLQRSLDFMAWSTVYSGANANFPDSGLTAATLYYYRVWATASGYSDSGFAITNATTLDPDGGGGGGGGPVGACYVPPGGNTADFLVKAGPGDFDLEWASFEEVPHDHDDRYYTKTEIDNLDFGSGGVFTGTI